MDPPPFRSMQMLAIHRGTSVFSFSLWKRCFPIIIIIFLRIKLFRCEKKNVSQVLKTLRRTERSTSFVHVNRTLLVARKHLQSFRISRKRVLFPNARFPLQSSLSEGRITVNPLRSGVTTPSFPQRYVAGSQTHKFYNVFIFEIHKI